MTKWYGKIGYENTVEQPIGSGIYVEQITERDYYGDLLRISRTLQSSGQVNDNINVSNEISILSDPFTNENFHSMRYVEFMGAKWKISNVTVAYPRLILTIGGLYNE